MRISDWSSDVCSSDLLFESIDPAMRYEIMHHSADNPLTDVTSTKQRLHHAFVDVALRLIRISLVQVRQEAPASFLRPAPTEFHLPDEISAERRVGQDCFSKCRSRWTPYQ